MATRNRTNYSTPANTHACTKFKPQKIDLHTTIINHRFVLNARISNRDIISRYTSIDIDCYPRAVTNRNGASTIRRIYIMSRTNHKRTYTYTSFALIVFRVEKIGLGRGSRAALRSHNVRTLCVRVTYLENLCALILGAWFVHFSRKLAGNVRRKNGSIGELIIATVFF